MIDAPSGAAALQLHAIGSHRGGWVSSWRREWDLNRSISWDTVLLMFESRENNPPVNACFSPKASEYTRSLVDKKKEGSVVSFSGTGQRRPHHMLAYTKNDSVQVLNGLKQRILKLEQQCREKENALRWRKRHGLCRECVLVSELGTFSLLFVQQAAKWAPHNQPGGAEDDRWGPLWRGNDTARPTSRCVCLTVTVSAPPGPEVEDSSGSLREEVCVCLTWLFSVK